MATHHEIFTHSAEDDPLRQNITFWSKDGMDNVVPLSELQRFAREMSLNSIQSGVQIALCFFVTGVLVLMTPRTGMRQPIFILNLTSVVLAFFRAIFLSLYITSPWTMMYTQFSNDLSYVSTTDYAYSYASSILTTFLTASVFASLVLQTRSVCRLALKRWVENVVIAISIVLITGAIGSRLVQCILNLMGLNSRVPLMRYWVLKTSYALTMAVLAWFTSIFMWKLGKAILNRRQYAWNSSRCFRTLFTAIFFTMFIPFILTCIEFSEAHIDLSTWTLTSAACLLPLSNVWAKSANEEDIRLSRASLNTSHVNLGYRNSNFPSQTSTAVYSERKGSAGQSYNKHNINTIIEHRSTVQSSRDSTEVDLERMGVRVDRSYSVLDQGR